MTSGQGHPSVAIVHERFTEYAGSERVVEALSQEWPEAPVFAPIARTDVLPAPFRDRVRPAPLNRLLRGQGGYAHLLPALPLVMRHLPVGDADVVVASHHAFATQIVHATSAPVVAYVHSPARWVWSPAMRRGEAGGAAGAVALATFATGFRSFDRRAATRVHTLVANSHAVAERIAAWWERPSVVVHPPVDTEFYTPDPTVAREDFFLLAGRVVPYKQPQIAVLAAARAGVRLVVAGDGRLRDEVEAMAGPGVTFLGRVDDATQRDLFRRCAALLMPGVEDFGIIPVEAQACGAPVLATAAGGSMDTVLPGITGELVGTAPSSADDAGDASSVAGVDDWAIALDTFRPLYDARAARRHAEGFSQAAFRVKMRTVIDGVAHGSQPP